MKSLSPDLRTATTAEICQKWYQKLNFPKKFDTEFKEALSRYKISDTLIIENYNLGEEDGKLNLLSFLFMCEELSRKYAEMGIDESILLDSLSDIRLWTEVWSDIKGQLYLGELNWVSLSLKMRLFRIGALEFVFGRAYHEYPEMGLHKGDNVMEIHIPRGTKFTHEECEKSLRTAKAFFKKHYPDFEYKHFTCDSWLLDKNLKTFLKEDSNILHFQNLFSLLESSQRECYDALKYVFKWNITKENLENASCISSFAEKIKNHVLSGGKLNVGFGIIMADRY